MVGILSRDLDNAEGGLSGWQVVHSLYIVFAAPNQGAIWNFCVCWWLANRQRGAAGVRTQRRMTFSLA